MNKNRVLWTFAPSGRMIKIKLFDYWGGYVNGSHAARYRLIGHGRGLMLLTLPMNRIRSDPYSLLKLHDLPTHGPIPVEINLLNAYLQSLYQD